MYRKQIGNNASESIGTKIVTLGAVFLEIEKCISGFCSSAKFIMPDQSMKMTKFYKNSFCRFSVLIVP